MSSYYRSEAETNWKQTLKKDDEVDILNRRLYVPHSRRVCGEALRRVGLSAARP